MNKAELRELKIKQKLVELLNKPTENLLAKNYIELLATDVYDFFEDNFKSRVNAINEQHAKDLDEMYESGRKDGFNTSAL